MLLLSGFRKNLWFEFYSLVSRLGGHSQPRTHRGAEKFPGMTITYALMSTFEDLTVSNSERATLLKKADVKKLIKENGVVVGVEFLHCATNQIQS